MPDAVTFIITALAVYRITHMVIYDEGAFSVLDRMRNAAKIHERNDWVSRGFSCPACVSFWVGLVAALITMRGENIAQWFVNVLLGALAYSAVAYALSRTVR